MVYNLLNCAGWEATGTGWIGSIPCIKARLGIIFLFFGIAFLRKWGGEELGMSFSFLFALLLGIIPYFIVITIFGSLGGALGIGALGALIGGYGGGMFFGGEDY